MDESLPVVRGLHIAGCLGGAHKSEGNMAANTFLLVKYLFNKSAMPSACPPIQQRIALRARTALRDACA